MDVTKITRTNNVSIFLLPLIPFTQGIFKYHIPYKGLGSRLLNAYLYDADVPKYQKNHISVVHTNVQDIGFRLFEKALENTPGFVDSYDIANTHYSVKVYRIPNDSLLSYEAFIRGEYSRFNLHDMASVLYYDYLGNKDYLTKVFKKDEDLRRQKEEVIGHSLEDCELWSIYDPKYDVLHSDIKHEITPGKLTPNENFLDE